MNTQNKVIQWMNFIDFGGIIIVTLVTGIILGELATEDLKRLSVILEVLSFSVCAVFSVSVGFFFRYERRRGHAVLVAGSMAILLAANVLRLIGSLPSEVHEVLFSVVSIFIACMLQINAVKDHKTSGPKENSTPS